MYTTASKLVLKSNKRAAFFALPFLLFACNSIEKRINNAFDIALKNNFSCVVEQSQIFPIQTFVKNHHSSHALIYLEGDGLVLVGGNIAINPTPTEPMALMLASVDDRSFTKIVINRPCQYVSCEMCSNKYWTKARYSEEIVISITKIIELTMQKYNFKTFDLVAYSGGAAIALLLVPYFSDKIKSIITFAGNLDHVEWAKFHEYAPLNQSLDPLQNFQVIKNITQIHFCGTSDDNTTVEIAENFSRKLNSSKIKILKIDGFKHDSNWPIVWKEQITKLK